MRRFLGFLIVIELLGAGLYFGGPPLDDWLQDQRNPTVQSGGVVSETSPSSVVEVLRPGQSRVTGTVTKLVARDAAGEAIPAPFTIQPGTVGVTRAVIGNVVVDRRPSTIAWDGGRPLPITGKGSLELGSAQLTADPGGLSWALDGSPRALAPGDYRANFTVAVGSSGVASVRDNVAFTAGPETALEVTKGTAFVRLPAQAVRIRATQPTSATLDGTFTIATAEASRPARRVSFGPGLYDITLTPVAGGYTVVAILQGPVAP
ncbi:MAG: hypothetical protein QOG87_1928 [Actinomycetota bacterium]